MMWLSTQFTTKDTRPSHKTHYPVKTGESLSNGWWVGDHIADGRMSRVWKISRGGECAAAKVFRRGAAEIESYENEIRIHGAIAAGGSLNGILSPLDTFIMVSIASNCKPRIHPVVVYPVCESSLDYVLDDIDAATAEKYSVQLFTALTAIHNADIIHTDISTGNLLVRNGDLLVGDFGSSVFVGEETHPSVGTAHFRAPELILRRSFGRPADVWSACVVVYEMFTKAPLFDIYGEYKYNYEPPGQESNMECEEESTDTTTESTDTTTESTSMEIETVTSSSGSDEDTSAEHFKLMMYVLGRPPEEFIAGSDTIIFKEEVSQVNMNDFMQHNFSMTEEQAGRIIDIIQSGVQYLPDSRGLATEILALMKDNGWEST